MCAIFAWRNLPSIDLVPASLVLTVNLGNVGSGKDNN